MLTKNFNYICVLKKRITLINDNLFDLLNNKVYDKINIEQNREMAEINSYVNLGDINFDQLFPDDISQKGLLNKNFIRFYNIILNIIYYKLICFKKKVGI